MNPVVSNQTASLGQVVQFSTTSSANTSYQWQTNPNHCGWQNVPVNSTYTGSSSNTLTLNVAEHGNHNQPFRVIATSGNCVDTSDVALLNLADTCITTINDTVTTYISVTDTLIINTTLGLNQNQSNTIKIYPNPAKDQLIIDNGNYGSMTGYTLTIKTSGGQQVFSSALTQAQFILDLSTWNGNGLYFVHLLDAQGNTVTIRKIILE